MAHPEIDNRSPFAFAPLFAVRESGRPLLVCVLKASFEISAKGALALAEEQLAVNFSGECRGDPASASYKYEPEIAWGKPDTDVVLIGHAWAERVNTSVLDVGFRVGPVRQIARVFGERTWYGEHGVAPPQPFERIPLIYERAFGGPDRMAKSQEKLAFEPRNPLGIGFYHKGKPAEDDRVPNIEDPRRPIGTYRDRPVPVGFGFTSPHFQPRADYGGTYDERWKETRSPFLPDDFDRRYFNAAPPALIAPGRLRGTERVVLHHVSSVPELEFALPGSFLPHCRVARRHGSDVRLQPELDTVIVNTDDARLVMLWRASLDLATGPQDVRAVQVSIEGEPERKPSSWQELRGVAA